MIEIWGNESIQTQLDGLKRNSEVFDTISSEMRKSGYEWTVKQCRNKIKKLKVEYRKAKVRREVLGAEEAKVWEYFDILDKVLGHKLFTRLPHVVDTVVINKEDFAQPIVTQEDLALAEFTVPPPPPDIELSQSTDDSSCVTPVRTLYQQSMPTDNTPATGRKRNRSGNEVLVAILGELVEKVVEAKLKSDMKMIELEEKRIKLEEKKIERDAEVRRDERDYQLKMLQCMMDSQLFRSSSSTTNPLTFSDVNEFQNSNNEL